jgi:uncharacterized membrane protein YidH (DUF202 family)
VTASEGVFDSGLQVERTLLAWQRTALSLAIVSAVAIRVLAVEIGPAGVAIGIAGLILAAVAYAVAWRRYRRAHLALTRGARLPDAGVVIAIVGAATLVLALAGVVVLIVTALR